MAVYDFKCGFCGDIKEDVILPMTHVREDRPACCGFFMETYITTAPTIHWKDYDVNYTPVSVKNAEPITSRRQEREFMKRHDLVHADFTPPSPEEDAAKIAEIKKSIEAISAPKGVDISEMDVI